MTTSKYTCDFCTLDLQNKLYYYINFYTNFGYFGKKRYSFPSKTIFFCPECFNRECESIMCQKSFFKDICCFCNKPSSKELKYTLLYRYPVGQLANQLANVCESCTIKNIGDFS